MLWHHSDELDKLKIKKLKKKCLSTSGFNGPSFRKAGLSHKSSSLAAALRQI
jgi:hypothetical protein